MSGPHPGIANKDEASAAIREVISPLSSSISTVRRRRCSTSRGRQFGDKTPSVRQMRLNLVERAGPAGFRRRLPPGIELVKVPALSCDDSSPFGNEVFATVDQKLRARVLCRRGGLRADRAHAGPRVRLRARRLDPTCRRSRTFASISAGRELFVRRSRCGGRVVGGCSSVISGGSLRARNWWPTWVCIERFGSPRIGRPVTVTSPSPVVQMTSRTCGMPVEAPWVASRAPGPPKGVLQPDQSTARTSSRGGGDGAKAGRPMLASDRVR